MPDNILKDTKRDQNKNSTCEQPTSGSFKWFVLVTFIMFSTSLATSWFYVTKDPLSVITGFLTRSYPKNSSRDSP